MAKYLHLVALLFLLGTRADTDTLILRLLRMDEKNFSLTLSDLSDTREFGNSFIEDLSKLNLKQCVMNDLWTLLLSHVDPTQMNRFDWSQYEDILHTVPEHLLYRVNITDWDLVEYLGSVKGLTSNQLATLADLIRHRFGNDVLRDADKTFRLGNLICGFNADNLQLIPSSAFRSLLERGFFRLIVGCGREQLVAFLNMSVKFTYAGPVATWSPRTVSLLGHVFSGLDEAQIAHVRDRSCGGLTSEVIRSTPVSVLKGMRREQLMSLERPVLMAWRRRTNITTCLESKTTAVVVLKALLGLTLLYMGV